MKLEKLALISEIVGSVAIVVTLLVLVFEVRGNSEELRYIAQSDVAARTQALILTTVSNPQLQEAYDDAVAGETLTPTQASLVNNYLVARLKLTEESFLAFTSGRLDEEIWQTRAAFALNTLQNKWAEDRWNTRIRTNGIFTPSFVDWVDAALLERSRQ